MHHPYLKHLVTAEDPQEALEESGDPQKILANARTEFVSLLERMGEEAGVSPSETSEATASDDGGPDLSEAKAAAKRALPPSKTEVTRATIGSEPTAMAAFSRNLPDGMTPSEALDHLE